MKFGIYAYGLAAAAAGIVNIVWGDFATGWQPIQAFGDHVPGRQLFAYITAAWLVLGGVAIVWRRTARAGATALALVYLIFAIFWLPRLYWAPVILGFHIPPIIGVFDGIAEQVILVAAGLLAYTLSADHLSASSLKMANISRTVFGLCVVIFGIAHFTSYQVTASMVPAWIYPGGEFWAAATGTCFVLAGIAILSGVLSVLAARLLSLMLLVFSALVWVPQLFATPHDQLAWGGNAYNLAAASAAWILADWLASRKNEVEIAKPIPSTAKG